MRLRTPRLAAIGAVVACTSLILTGCGGASEESGGGTVRVVVANHPWTDAVLSGIDEFEEETGLTVEVTSYTEDQLSQQLNVRLNASADDIDVMMMRPLQEVRTFHENGWLTDLTEWATTDETWDWSDFQEGPQASVTVDDQVLAVPLSTEREVLYYRKDLLDEAGLEVPQTLEELEEAARMIQERNEGVYGFVSRGARAAAVTQFSSFLYSYGADWETDDGTSGIGTPEARAAYTFYGDMLRNYGPPGVTNMSWPEAMAIFTQGRAAFYTEADSLYTNATDPESSTVTETVGFAQFPAGPAGSRPTNVPAWALAVPSTSNNQEAAWEFVRWATNQENTLKAQEGGVIGSRASAWEAQVDGTFPEDLAEAQRASAEVGVGYSHPVVLNVSRARDIVGEPIVTAIEGGDVEAALDAADQAFSEFLADERE
ncbi:carbohydrate ABC transporter substrate-binding protein (CUT1 family) [Georgenia soli]|uniref:Carbohydrate ABC transporter substrate-binding protein (CUT1 family) n=1 Tax=Georgenia soli TaxID=638953 RepID=A0A2A9F0N7_9MICO|nr:sugar ABC transporter substrate-binding protein [Georgenia soli]PFG44967.1 carbohydrate ABC transporter substrate-binding protein (CUT1 family) [Georgenia soli]